MALKSLQLLPASSHLHFTRVSGHFSLLQLCMSIANTQAQASLAPPAPHEVSQTKRVNEKLNTYRTKNRESGSHIPFLPILSTANECNAKSAGLEEE